MTQITLNLPNDLALRLRPVQNRLAEIIEIGLREISATKHALQNEVIDFLASGPSPEAIITFRPTENSIERVRELLDKNRTGSLTLPEQRELDQYEELDYLMTLVKARARQKFTSHQ